MTDLLELVAEHDELADLDPAARRLALRSLLLGDVNAPAASSVVAELADTIDGYGPLTPLMTEPGVTDVLVNGPADVWVERHGRLEQTSVRFATPEELHTLVNRLSLRTGVSVDPSHPLADARLPDGSRLHIALPPVAPTGPLLSIRRFPEAAFRLEDLVARRMLTADEARFLVSAVKQRQTMAISGGTGSGKTTLLNALLSEIGPAERVVVVEETSELHPRCPHWVSLLSRGPNLEGEGAITVDDLVRAALRMRPDRIVVGEVRGPEAYTALSAMSVGHEGSLVTVHARSSMEVVERLVSLALTHRARVSESSLRRQISNALALLVHVVRDDDGRRRVAEITELG